MGGIDGSLRFDTKIDTEGFKQGLSGLEGLASSGANAAKSALDSLSQSMNQVGSNASKTGADISSSMAKTAESAKASGTAVSESSKAVGEFGKAASESGNSAKKAADDLDKMAGEAKKTGDEVKGAGEDAASLGKQLEQAGSQAKKSMESLGGISEKVAGAIKAAFAAVVAGLLAAGGYALKVGSDFEAGMSKVAAISGATSKNLSDLTEKAKEMGSKTKFSATESASAFEYMAMAGWKTQDMLGGIEGIMNLAAASGENLASVSDIVTDGLTAFGMHASESGHFADVLAAAASNANTNVGMMGATFKYVAPVAGAMKYSIEDVSVAIGLMANSGIKAEQAGTALSAVLTNLVKPPKDAAAALDALGISAANSDGSMRPLRDVIVELREKFAGLTDEQKASYAASIAGQDAMKGLLAIVNASESDFEKLASAIDNADGSALRMAEIMQNNLQGSLTILGSTVESLGIRFYESIGQTAKNAVNALIRTLSSSAFKSAFDRISNSFGELTEQAARLAEKVLPVLVEALAFLSENLLGIAKTAAIAFASFETFKIVRSVADWFNAASLACKAAVTSTKEIAIVNAAAAASQAAMNGQLTLGQLAWGVISGKIGLAAAAQAAWNAVAAANPLGLVIAAVAAFTVGVSALAVAVNGATGETKELISECGNLISESQTLRDTIASEADQWKKNISNLEAEAGAAHILTDRLFELAGQTKKTTEDKALMASLVDQLNKKFPELGLSIDKETGALNLNKDAVYSVIDANLELMKSQAAYDRMSEVAKNIAEVEIELENLRSKQKEVADQLQEEMDKTAEANKKLKESYDGTSGALIMVTGNQRELMKQSRELDTEIAASEEALASLTEEFDNCQAYAEKTGAEFEKTGESAESAGESLDGLGDSAQSMKDRFAEAMKGTSDSAAEASKIVDETLKAASDAATNAFAEIQQNTALSVDEMISNLQKNQEAVRQWSENLKVLAEYGINEGIIAVLREGGPEMAAQTQVIADLIKQASDESLGAVCESARSKLEEFNNIYLEGFTSSGQNANQALEAQLTSMQGTIATGMDAASQSAAAGAEGIASSTLEPLVNLPEETGQIAQDAVNSFSGQIAAGASQSVPDLGAPVVESAEKAATDVQPPAQETAQVLPNELNEAVPETKAAADANTTAVTESMNTMADKVKTTLEPAKTAVGTWLDSLTNLAQTKMPVFVKAIEHPLKQLPVKMKSIGQQTVQGIWAGMQSQQGWLNSQVAGLVISAIEAAKAAGEIHSPSRKTANEVGAPLAEGIAVGVQEKLPEVSQQVNGWIAELIDEFGETALNHCGLSAEKIVDSLSGMYDTIKEQATNAFSTVKESEALSVRDMISNLRDNQRAIEEWADNLQRAADRGLNEGFLKSFREMGPAMNESLANIVDSSDREFDRLNAQYEASAQTILTAFDGALASLEPTIRAAIEGSVGVFKEMPGQAGSAVAGTGSQIAGSLSSGSGEITAAAGSSVSGAAAEYGKLPQAAKDAAAGTNSALATALSSGSQQVTTAAAGIVTAIETEFKALAEKARTAGTETAKAFTLAISNQFTAEPPDFLTAVENAGGEDLMKAAGEAGKAVAAAFVESANTELEQTPPPLEFESAVEEANNEALQTAAKEAGKGVGESFVSGIKAQLEASPPDFKTAMEISGKAAVEATGTAFAMLPEVIQPHLDASKLKFDQWFQQIVETANAQLPIYSGTVTNALDALNAEISLRLDTASDSISQWFTRQIDEANSRMPAFTSAVLSPMERLPGEFQDIGTRMVEGLWNGMDSMRGWLEGQIQDFVDSAVDAARSAADIHSPSRRMADSVGAPMAEGIGVGFEDNLSRLERGMRVDIGSLVKRMESEVLAEASRYGQKAAVMQTNNHTVNNQNLQGGGINITINWTGGSDDVDIDRIARKLGRKADAEFRARGLKTI